MPYLDQLGTDATVSTFRVGWLLLFWVISFIIGVVSSSSSSMSAQDLGSGRELFVGGGPDGGSGGGGRRSKVSLFAGGVVVTELGDLLLFVWCKRFFTVVHSDVLVLGVLGIVCLSGVDGYSRRGEN